MRSDYSAHNGRVGNADKSRAASSEDLVVSQLTGSKGPVPGHVSDRRIGEDRRHHRSILGFIYGNFRPRRRLHRRKDDEHFFWFDWHEPKILYIALAIVLLSCTDALFTLNLLKIGA
ncbi:MAG: hypothetical protein OEU86_02400, partial [Gammaproteobacteria bacterium]|nr:hypothetical protein [Gammaproteobacteria bacterium]